MLSFQLSADDAAEVGAAYGDLPTIAVLEAADRGVGDYSWQALVP